MESLVCSPAPVTPEGTQRAHGSASPSPAKRRRNRGASLRHGLWQRTQWAFLSEEEDEEEALANLFVKRAKSVILDELGSTLGTVLETAGVIRSGDLVKVRQSILEEVGLSLRAVLSEVGVVREADLAALTEVVASLRTEQMKVKPILKSESPKASDVAHCDFEGLACRVKALESNAAAKGEGLRKKCERLSMELKGAVARIRWLEDRAEESDLTDLDGDSGDYSEVDDGNGLLSRFRHGLRPGMPVHIDGLASNPALNGKAGFLGDYEGKKDRWQITVGPKALLIRPENIFP